MNTIELLKNSFFTHLQKTFNISHEQLHGITFTLNTDRTKKDFGDISSNAAMILAKLLQQNPRTIAQTIINTFRYDELLALQIAGPGFLNFFLSASFFMQIAQQLFIEHDSFFQLDSSEHKEHISLEFVSANPTGPLHLGHGRGGIIGDVLANIVRFLGHKVFKEFYINDAGTQIKKLGISLKIRCQQALGHEILLPDDAYHGEYLKDLAQHYIQEFGNESINQSEDIFAHYAQDYLLTQIQHTLGDYGIIYDVWFSEKTLHDNDLVHKAIASLQSRNVTYIKDNALWFTSTQFGDDKDRVLQRADGNYTYIAADVAYLQNKLQRGFSQIIMILGQDHHSYGTRMKAIMSALGYNPNNLHIILYQLVAIKEGNEQVRMSKRAGTLVTLADVIKTVGKDVARFFYLNRKADAHLDFDLTLALKHTEENPVYYIQYAYVRINSVLEKAYAHQSLQGITATDLTEVTPDEIMLIKKLVELKELLIAISKNYQTHLVAYYVFELAQAFHHYYNGNRIIDLEATMRSRSRLAFIILIKNTLEFCLNLLGLSTPEKM